LPANVHISSNDAGITGGIRLWDDHVWNAVRSHVARLEH
jgi:polyphosphate glucokinase